jgi:CubicO group peptidase (beta-lactamase class C family)
MTIWTCCAWPRAMTKPPTTGLKTGTGTAPFFQKAPTHEPGTVFSYDTSASQALGALCQKLSGEGLLPFLQRRVFDPIGATDDSAGCAIPQASPGRHGAHAVAARPGQMRAADSWTAGAASSRRAT